MGPPPPVPGRGLLLAIAGILVVVAAGWFLFLRGSGGASGEFLTAHDRFVGAAHRVVDAQNSVERYLQLSDFKATVDGAIVVLKRESAVFQRLSTSEDGQAREIATKAYADTVSALQAVDTYADAIVRTLKIADAQNALRNLQSAVDDLDAQAAAWRKLT